MVTIASAGDDITDNRVSALVISMSYHSIVDIPCLRVFKTSSSHAPCFSLSPIHLDPGIDSFNSLPSSIRGAFLGHTNLENSTRHSNSPSLQSLHPL